MNIFNEGGVGGGESILTLLENLIGFEDEQELKNKLDSDY